MRRRVPLVLDEREFPGEPADHLAVSPRKRPSAQRLLCRKGALGDIFGAISVTVRMTVTEMVD